MIGYGTIDCRIMADGICLAFRGKGYTVWSEEFFYSTPFVTMPGDGTPQPQQIRFDPDSYFVQIGTFISIRNEHGIEGFAPTVGVLLKDADTGYFFSDDRFSPIPAQHQAGSGTEPYLLPVPYVWKPGGRASIVFRTLNTGLLGTVQVSLWGVKLFTRPYTDDRFDKIGFVDH
jgi:hypothetical protein